MTDPKEKCKLTPIPRPGPLNTLRRVRGELARVYRDARTRRLDPADATKLTYMLGTLARILEVDQLEERIAALEERRSPNDAST